VSPVRYELGFYIPEDEILQSRCLPSFNRTLFFLMVTTADDGQSPGDIHHRHIVRTLRLLLRAKVDALPVCSGHTSRKQHGPHGGYQMGIP
jgi:hypothetical protein